MEIHTSAGPDLNAYPATGTHGPDRHAELTINTAGVPVDKAAELVIAELSKRAWV
jgi:hypothetical protein